MSQPLRLDLHTHPKVAKTAAFEPSDVLAHARTLAARGLRGLAMTEHAHAPDFWRVYDAMFADYPYRDGRFEVGGALFYPGMEVTLAEDVDILLIGPIDELRRFDEAFSPRLTQRHHPGAAAFAETIDRLSPDVVRIAAHPVRDDRSVREIPPALLRTIAHAVEINSRYADARSIAEAQTLALELDRPMTGGSDAHAWPQLGAAFTEVRTSSDSFADLRDAVLTGAVDAHVHPDADRLAATGRRLKKRLKARRPRLDKLPKRRSQDEPLSA